MKIRSITSVFLSIACLVVGEEGSQKSLPKQEAQDQHTQFIVRGNNQFAFDLLHQIGSHPDNLFFSPYSIAYGLGLVASGAKGETANEMQRTLHYSLSLLSVLGHLNQLILQSSQVKNAASVWPVGAVWLQKDLPLLPAYQYALQRDLNASLEFVDFQHERINSIKIINEWISKHTQNRIHAILQAQDLVDVTQFVLTTAFSMKGAWMYRFGVKQTVKAPFSITAKQTRLVEMMHQTANYPVWVDQAFTLLALPYAEKEGEPSRFSLVIFLPKEVLDWPSTVKLLTAENWQQWIGKLHPQRVHVGLPRFRIEEKINLNPVMQALGIKQAFTSQADFSGMMEREKLFLNKAVHKATIRIDENGSEAGSARLLPAVEASDQTLEVVVDRPFFFFIFDRQTASILGIGRVVRP